jgi:hypothetical protein
MSAPPDNKNMKIKYISWNYGNGPFGKLHLIRLTNGQGLLKTSKEMVVLGLAVYK